MMWLDRIRRADRLNAIGLMSGTSADGLDLAFISIDQHTENRNFNLIDFISRPYSDDIRRKILETAAPNGGRIEDVCKLNFLLGHIYARTVLDFLQEKELDPKKIDFVGSHGQTVCHLPEKKTEQGIVFGSTLQISDPSVIASRTGIVTVGDFRIADVALGGEGAPLVPFFDYLHFRHPQKHRVILNIGGIANLTYLPPHCTPADVLAFDTGPGNVLIDSLTAEFFGLPYDENGKIASSGNIHPELLRLLLDDDYFAKEPPKSTGRESFTGPFYVKLKKEISALEVKPNDLIATISELTARSIADSVFRYLTERSQMDELIVSGGGADNPFLMKRLAYHFGKIKIYKSDVLGVPGEAKEAICFALLAHQTFLGMPANLPSVTGAKSPAILGKICLPAHID